MVDSKRKWTDEQRRRHSERIKQVLADRNLRARITGSLHDRYKRDPDLKQRIAEKMREQWANPEYRQRMKQSRGDTSGRMRALWADPTRRAAREAAMQRLPIGATRMSGDYVVVKVSDTEWVLEHRHVMQRTLGRDLLPTETVHHRNGNRVDNRPDNLELWNSAHPSGQRAEDLLRFAREVEALYGHLFPAT